MSDRIDRGGWALNAEITGAEGTPAILMSNSLGATRAMWDRQADMLAETNRVIRYDTRGHGASDTPPGPFSFDDLVDDALAVLDHYRIARATYIGLSLGGMTGLGVALRAPERVKRLVVAAARADNPPPFVQSWDDRMAAIAEGGVGAIWGGTLDRWLTPAFAETSPEQVAALEHGFLQTTADGYAGCAEALKTLNYLPDLGGIACPTLYIAGAEDMGAPPAAMEAMAAATPGSSYHCIPDAAHIVNVNAAETFDGLLRDFLKG